MRSWNFTNRCWPASTRLFSRVVFLIEVLVGSTALHSTLRLLVSRTESFTSLEPDCRVIPHEELGGSGSPVRPGALAALLMVRPLVSSGVSTSSTLYPFSGPLTTSHIPHHS